MSTETKKERPVLRSLGYYILAVFAVITTYKILLELDLMGIIDTRENKSLILILPGVYLICGYLLNVFITNRLIKDGYLEYHQFSNTIDSIARDKFKFLIFWVFKYPFFLLQIAFIETA